MNSFVSRNGAYDGAIRRVMRLDAVRGNSALSATQGEYVPFQYRSSLFYVARNSAKLDCVVVG